MSDKPVAVITGASSGIGLETALAFARKGYTVVPSARRAERLDQIAEQCRSLGAEARPVVTDVADERQVRNLVATAVDEFGRIDVMVNNAGHGVFAAVHETPTGEMRQIFDVNFFGVFYGCKAAVPEMLRRGRGHIFNVSSVIGKRGTPMHGAYCATKFAIAGLTESLRVELMSAGVHVTLVCPTTTETEFFDRTPTGKKAGAGLRKYVSSMPAAVVGRKIAAVAGRRKPELVFSAAGKLLALSAALAPGFTDHIMKVYRDDLAKRLKKH
ncbi:MAG: SDR family oxidoreductase [Phycisphaerae bacterium]